MLSRSSTARVRCPKNEALSNSTPVTAVTSFESRQVHRSSQVCTRCPPAVSPTSVQIGAAPTTGRGPNAQQHTHSRQHTAQRDLPARVLCYRLQSSSASRFTAAQAGVLHLEPVGRARPER